jgi:hypothetical protein
MLPLASCDMLFVGMFPADIAQITSRVDLSGKIAAAYAASYNLSVLKLGATEYVLLFSTDGYDPTLTHLLVLSPALKILDEYTLNDLNVLVGDPFKGNGAVAHLYDSTIVVGNVVMVPNPSGLTASSKLPSGVELLGDTIVGPGPGFLLWTNFRTDSSGNLYYEQHAADWSTSVVQSHAMGKDVHFAGAFTDPEDSGSLTAMLVFEDSSNTQYFIQVPKDPDMAGGWPTPALLDNPQYLPFTTASLDSQSLQVTKTGIVSYDYSSRAWVRFLPSAPKQKSQMDVGRRSGSQRSAFSYSGGCYYVFDADTTELTRYEDWW